MERRRARGDRRRPTHERLFAIGELLRRAGATRRDAAIERIRELSAVDRFWLNEFAELVALEERIRDGAANGAYAEALQFGYATASLRRLHGDGDSEVQAKAEAAFRMVDTAAAEFPAKSPYYYLSRGEHDEMRRTPVSHRRRRQRPDPHRPGHRVRLQVRPRGLGAPRSRRSPGRHQQQPRDRLDGLRHLRRARLRTARRRRSGGGLRATGAHGVMLAFGGQTAINLAGELHRRGVRIVGSDRSSVDMAEDREQFDAALARLGVARPQGKAARSFREARAIARELGFPVLVRPSFVLGGRAMEIVYNEGQLASYVETAPPIIAGAPLLVDKYLPGLEVEVDAVYDGEDILIPGIFEHMERAGIHSGDSISVYPPQTIDASMEQRIVEVTLAIAHELRIRGLINIQFVIHDERLFIIEANPRASRTVPIIPKVTGMNFVAAATRVALGEKLRDMEYGTGLSSAHALRGGESAGLFVFEDARRGDDPWPGDEVDRRGARHR